MHLYVLHVLAETSNTRKNMACLYRNRVENNNEHCLTNNMMLQNSISIHHSAYDLYLLPDKGVEKTTSTVAGNVNIS
jgi:hypothetical protein